MKTTGKVVVGLAGVALAYEAYTLANKEEDDTISEFVWSTVRRPLMTESVMPRAASSFLAAS